MLTVPHPDFWPLLFSWTALGFCVGYLTSYAVTRLVRWLEDDRSPGMTALEREELWEQFKQEHGR